MYHAGSAKRNVGLILAAICTHRHYTGVLETFTSWDYHSFYTGNNMHQKVGHTQITDYQNLYIAARHSRQLTIQIYRDIIHQVCTNNQSAYQKSHIVQSALLCISDTVLTCTSLDAGKEIIMVMLDLSVAFDKIDHSTLMAILHSNFGITDKALC